MAGVLAKHAGIAARVVELFHARFDPEREAGRDEAQAAILAAIEADLAAVESLDEDRILRRFVNLVQSMLRTNVYQRDAAGKSKPVISFKLDAQKVEGLPAPRPLYEIFVMSPRVEGVHLRFGKVARGGIPLVGPAGGLPHRSARPREGAAGQERGHRAGRRQGRLRAEAVAAGLRPPGLADRGHRGLQDLHLLACST